MKRYFFMILVFVLCLSSPVHALPSKDYKKVEKLVTRYMEAVKRYDTKTYLNCYQPKKYRKGIPFWTDKSLIKYLKRTKKYFSYDIRKITIKNKKAYAYLRVSYYDVFFDIRDAWVENYYDYLIDGNFYFDLFCKYDLASAFEYREDRDLCIDTKNIKIPLIKRNGKWKIEKQSTSMSIIEDGGFYYWYDFVIEHYP